MSSVTNAISPYNVFQLQFPQTTFRLESYPSSSGSNTLDPADNGVRLLPQGGSLASAIGSDNIISTQTEILTSYSNGAALVTRATLLKGGVVA